MSAKLTALAGTQLAVGTGEQFLADGLTTFLATGV
jgi:hypothetical protein